MTQTENVMRDKLQEQVEIALSVARVAYWEYEVADEVFIFNDAAYNILQTTLEKEGSYRIPAADYMARFVHPDDAGILIDEIRRAFKSDDPDFTSDHEYRVIWGNGQSGYLNILFKAERDENGRVTRLYGTGQDITQRRQNEDALVKRATKTEALLSLTRVASGSLDLETILNEALTQALIITGFDTGLVSMVNPETQLLELRTHRLPDEFVHSLQNDGFDGTLCHLIYQRQEPIVITDLSNEMPVDVSGLQSLGFQSYQGVPIVAKGKVMGTVCLFGRNRLKPEEADIDLLQAIGQQVGFAIRNAALFEQTQFSEARYRTLFDSAADAIDILDGKGNIIDCNETYLHLLDYGRDAIIGQHITDFFAPESVKLFKKFFPQVQKTGRAEGELTMTRRDGSTIHIWRKAQAIYDADNQIVSIVGYNRDVTERKLAEIALQEAQSRAQVILNAVTSPMLISKVSDGEILYANQQLSELIRLPLTDLIGNATPDFYYNPADDRPALLSLIQEKGAAPNYELRLKRGDGEPFWAIISIQLFDYQGEKALITTILDITERKEIEDAQRQSEEKFRTLFEKSADAYLILGDNVVIDCNQAIVDMFNVAAKEDVLSLHPSQLSPERQPDDQLSSTKADEMIQTAVANGSHRFEWMHRRANSEDFPAEVLLSPITLDGAPAVFAVIHDVTERKLAETALHEAQTRAQTILDAVTTPLLISKVSDGKILYANELLADMIQLPLDDLIGDVTPDFYFDPDDRPKLLNLLREHGVATDYELQLKRGSGESFWASISIKIFDFQGEAALITTFLDVTERKQMTLALQRAQARSQFILESVTLPLLVSRIKDGTVIYANDRIAEMVGIAPEDVMGNQTPDFYHNPEDRLEILNAIREHGGIDNKELALKRADGKLLWAILSNRLVDFEGEPAIITTLIDITARKEAEEALARRAAEFEMVSRVSASAATILETDKLLQEVIDLTKERFNLYHAHIYLLNANGDALVLTAGAGDVGRQMVSEGRSILLSREQSLVAQAARTGQGVTENDVRENPAFLPHPLLPHTRAEMAAPMIVGDRVIGVLDVQSDEVGRFTEQDVMISTTLAAQIAVALENARSFEQAREAVTNLNEITRRLTREGWQEYLADSPSETTGFVYDPAQINPMLPLTGVVSEATAVTTAVNGTGAASLLAQAITVHGETIGELAVEPDEADEQEMAELITAVAEQLSARIENLRLTDQTQTALAEAERQSEELALINRVVTNVAASLNLQESLEIVAAELAQAIAVEQVAITLLNEARTEATVVAEYFGESEYERALGIVFSLADNPLTQQVVDSRQPVIVVDAQHNLLTAPIHDVMRARGTQTLVILPMTSGNEVIGTVGIDILDEKRTLREVELRLAETLIFQAATAVQNARLFNQTQQALDETEEQARRLAQLNQMSAALNQAEALADVYDTAVRETSKVLPVNRVSLALYHDDDDCFEVVAFWGEEMGMPVGSRLPAADSPLLTAITENRIVGNQPEGVIASALFAPLFVSGRAIGVLNVGDEKANAYDLRDEQLLRQIAALAGSIIETRRLLENEQNRARREQTLREIAEKVRGSADVETIMRTAVTEVGRALGRRTYISLDENAVNTDSVK